MSEGPTLWCLSNMEAIKQVHPLDVTRTTPLLQDSVEGNPKGWQRKCPFVTFLSQMPNEPVNEHRFSRSF